MAIGAEIRGASNEFRAGRHGNRLIDVEGKTSGHILIEVRP